MPLTRLWLIFVPASAVPGESERFPVELRSTSLWGERALLPPGPPALAPKEDET